jgi:hypothetical protein
MPSKPTPKESVAVARSLQTVGMRSLSKAVGTGLEQYHRTPGGRIVVLKFPVDGEERRVYLDQIVDTLRVPAPKAFAAGAFGTGAKRPSVRRAPAKKAAKKTFKQTLGSKSVPIVATRSWGGDEGLAFGKASARIPKPIREFAMYFLINIRKIVCPAGKQKVVLGAATTSIVGSLAIWLVSTFKMTSEVANTLASAVLIAVVTATKGAFCDMTAAMAKAALKKA